MEFYHLQSFLMVARTKNLTRAAEKLNTTPPSVSNHIKALEDELNLALFTRTPKGMEITPQGEALIKQAQGVIRATDQFFDTAKSLQGTLKGRIRFGINADPKILRIPETIQAMHQAHPDIRVEIIASSTGEILEALARDDMDCGFAFGRHGRTGLETDFLCRLDLVIALPVQYRSSHGSAPLAHLEDLPWIAPDNLCPFFQAVKQRLDEKSIVLDRILHANDDITKIAFVEQGLGVSVLLLQEALPFREAGIIHIWKGLETFESELFFTLPALRAKDPVLGAFRQCIRETWTGPGQ